MLYSNQILRDVKNRREALALMSLACLDANHVTCQQLVQRLFNKKGSHLVDADEMAKIITQSTHHQISGYSIKRMVSSGRVIMPVSWHQSYFIEILRADYQLRHLQVIEIEE